jgi:hypothetical protein
MYKQCTLKKDNVFHKAWIPSVFAVKGKRIQIKNDIVQFGSQWEVLSVGDTELSKEYVRELERDYLHQRKASDI